MTDTPSIRPQMGDFVLLETLRWWRQLVDANPQDLAPRLDAAIERASLPQGSTEDDVREAKIDALASKLTDTFGSQFGFTEWSIWRPVARCAISTLADMYSPQRTSTPAQSGLVEARRLKHAFAAGYEAKENGANTWLEAWVEYEPLQETPSQPAPVVAGWKLVPDIGTEVNVRDHPQGPFKVFERKIDEFSPHAICVRGNDTAWFNIDMLSTSSTRPQMGDELLPCPFCEGTHVVVCKNDMQHTAYCTDCEAEGPLALSQEDAITAWNRRASSQMGDEELRELFQNVLVERHDEGLAETFWSALLPHWDDISAAMSRVRALPIAPQEVSDKHK